MSIRLVWFVAVGTLCLLIQLLFLSILEHYTHPTIANGIGFLISAQLNFILSYYVTWHDSARKKGRYLAATWVNFNLVVVFSACINAVAFSLVRYMLTGLNAPAIAIGLMGDFIITPNIIAATVATGVSTVSTFLINHHFVLKPEKRGESHGRTARNSNVSASVE